VIEQQQPSPAAFEALGLMPALVQAATAAGWTALTPIQALAMPAVLQGRDVLATAPTGSGKTAAFLLPLLQTLLTDPAALAQRPRRLHALILVPTRELAAQIGEVLQALTRSATPALKTVVAVGGLSINPQMMALRGGAQFVVATPGRLLDLVDQGALQLGDLPVLVLDEADRLLDLGFADEVGRLLALLPQRRQTLLFSATLPAAVAALAGRLLQDPLRLAADDGLFDEMVGGMGEGGTTRPPADIRQRAIEVDSKQRTMLLRHLIKSEGWQRVLVFVATQYASEHLADKLRRAKVPAAALHGQLSQGRRTQALADFQASRLRVLVATDLAARGIDVVGLAAVVNHDLPRSAVDYTHRIGRTGRAGEQGVALSFISPDLPGSEAHFRLIEKRQGQRVTREQVPGFEPVAPAALPQVDLNGDLGGGIKGRRKSKKDKLREAAAAAAAPRRPGRAGG
jgi:ATP-dependent RNA helicase RhlE